MNQATRKAYAQSIRTVYDAGQERRDEAAESIGRATEAQSKLNLERAKLRLYPEVGILNRKGKSIFYAYVGGYAESNYVESADLDAVCRKVDGGKPRITAPIL